MFWVHIHNAAGTSIAKLARAFHERPLEPATGIWNYKGESSRDRVKCGPGSRANATFACADCAGKAAEAARQGATWTAIERPLEASDFGCDFDYGVTIRDPVATMMTTIVLDKVDVDALFARLETGRGPVGGADLPHRRGYLQRRAPLAHFDNYATRILLGYDVLYNVGLGELTEAHFAAAVKILERFDVVLALPTRTALDTGPLRTRRGWPTDQKLVINARNRSQHGKETYLTGGDPSKYRARVDLLEKFATYDRRLLAVAERLAKRPVAASP
jgi:hypothetical protein